MFEHIEPEELHALRAQTNVVLVDVRTDPEVARGMIAGARHIPLFALAQRASELEQEATIIVYCQSGGRSAQACMYLAREGYTHLYNLSGGILGWMRAGLEVTQG
ncbi:MAG: rhodanese-like domain-containing protein [Burkholderiales bacterium]